ncbi:MAG: 30S ribosomal protein S7 [Spirochaetes bacterium]|nr:30S ribosomal protein S7 [Spirochaetota bacterium]
MSRKKRASKREIKADLKYNSLLVTRFINKIMYDGKRSVAEKIVYNVLDLLQEKTNKSPLEIFEAALNNIKPEIEVKSRRIGGATYQIPIEVPRHRQISLALNWIIGFARSRKAKPMHEKLAAEVLDAYNNTGSAIKKKEDTHKMADANRAFAHFRW